MKAGKKKKKIAEDGLKGRYAKTCGIWNRESANIKINLKIKKWSQKN